MHNLEDEFKILVAAYKDTVLAQFTEDDVLNKRIELIANHLSSANITSVILGISGGIDSSVVLGLLSEVKNRFIPELKIYGYCITFNEVYGHVFETKYIDLLKYKYESDDISITVLDCTKSLKTMIEDLELDADKQLLAQASYALRYQMFFTFAQRYNAVTFGTTNRDEFEYVGWFGKNSDMVVDFQVITDWHKCEVIEAAKILGVPEEIITRTPSGDLVNKSSDEDNFGCTYDELAYFGKCDDESFYYGFLAEKYEKVKQLHKTNIHKYQGQTFNPIFIN